MLSLRPVASAAVHRSLHPANLDLSALLDCVGAHEAADRDSELARLLRIARLNRHAETEK